MPSVLLSRRQAQAQPLAFDDAACRKSAGVPAFQCRHCGKPFKSRGWLAKHESDCQAAATALPADCQPAEDPAPAFRIYANDVWMRLDYDFCLTLSDFIRQHRPSNPAIAIFGKQLEAAD